MERRQRGELYRCHWQIEVFFKQVKQTLQLANLLGHNANAVQWQIWMALLVYVLFAAPCGSTAASTNCLIPMG
jgi:hypothetical protein